MGPHFMDLVVMVLDDAQRGVILHHAETDYDIGKCEPLDAMHRRCKNRPVVQDRASADVRLRACGDMGGEYRWHRVKTEGQV